MTEDKEKEVLELREQIRQLKHKYQNVRWVYILSGLCVFIGIPLILWSVSAANLESLAAFFGKNTDAFVDMLGYIMLLGLSILFAAASKHLKKIENKIEKLHLKVSEIVLSFSNPDFEFKPEKHDLHKLSNYEEELQSLEALEKRKKNWLFKFSGCLTTGLGLVSIFVFLFLWEMMSSPSIGFGAILIFPVLLITGFYSLIFIISIIATYKKRGFKKEHRLEELQEKVHALKALQSDYQAETVHLLKNSNISNDDLKWCQNRQKFYKRNLFLSVGAVWAALSYLFFGDAVWSFITLQDTFGASDIISLILLWFIYGVLKSYFDLAYQADIKKHIFPKICEALGLEYSTDPVFQADDIRDHGIMPVHKFLYVDDAFRGTYNERVLEFQEFISSKYDLKFLDADTIKGPIGRLKMSMIGPKAYLWKAKNEKGYARGIMARIPLNKNLYFQTIAEKQGKWKYSFNQKLQAVSLLSPELEHRYKISSSDQVEAREIFDPAFMERFVLLADHLGGEKFFSSFYKDELCIVILSDYDYFDVGDLSETLSLECFEPLVRQTQCYKEIIDLLDLSPERGI